MKDGIIDVRFQSFNISKLNFEISTIEQIDDLPNREVFLSLRNDYYSSDENYLNELRQKQQRNDFSRKLISCIKEQHFEYGITSSADILVEVEMNKNKLATKSTLNELFVNNFDNPSVLTGILQIISRISNDKINPEGQTMAIAALSHKDLEVRECGIRCFESWVSQSSLTVLKNIKTEPQWLQDYVQTVINNIEEELCHI